MDTDARKDATAINNWSILAQRTSDASCKIYLWIFKVVDAPIRTMIVTKTGDGRAAIAIISEMFDKPSRMLQRRLIACFYSGSFDAGKGIVFLISQINDTQIKINSMGKSLSLESILSKVGDLKAALLTAKTSSGSSGNTTGRLNSSIFRAAAASPLATGRRVIQASTITPTNFDGVTVCLKDLESLVNSIGVISDDDKASVLL
jgi:hypothetical protein